MEISIDRGVSFLASGLDRIRAQTLQVTTRSAWLRTAFCHRALRLGALFAVAFTSSLGLSLFFPLWVLAIGPMVYGVPHLASSIRYFHYLLGRTRVPELETSLGRRARCRAYFWALALMTLICVYRLIVNVNVLELEAPPLSEWRGSTYLEFLGLIFTVFAGAWIYRKGFLSVLLSLISLGPLAYAFYREPFWTVGALVLVHNFIGFFYWIHASRTRSEKGVAIGALLLTALLTVWIFLGSLEWIYGAFGVFKPAEILEFAGISFEGLGALVTPWAEVPSIWLRVAVAYAFGQSLHYFVWMKAIPDQYHSHEVPTSFRQSMRLLESDFGRIACFGTIAITVASFFIWAFVQFPLARMIYFAMAGFHGYLEIAGLALAAGQMLASRISASP